MKSNRVLLCLLPLAVACADDGATGKNSLVETSNEAAGSNCEAGGLKVERGLDSNGNGELDTGEVEATDYVCSGSNGADGSDGSDGTDGVGAEDVTTSVADATSAQCGAGGKAITFLNAEGEPTGDPLVVCNTAVSDGFGTAPITRTVRLASSTEGVVAGEEFSAAGAQAVLSGTITVPGRGTILAFGSSLAYCDSTGTAPEAGSCYNSVPATTGAWLTVVPTATPTPAGSSNDATYQLLAPDVDNSVQVTTSFEIAVGGTYNYTLVGMASDPDHTTTSDGTVASTVYYGASRLSLVFVPHN